MHILYFPTMSAHASWGSLAVENSMHSSRAAFSSLQTQQGLGLLALSVGVEGLLEAARLLICEADVSVRTEGSCLRVDKMGGVGGGWTYWLSRGRTFWRMIE